MKNAISGLALENGLILTSDGITCIAQRKSGGEISVKIKNHPNYIRRLKPFALIALFLLAMLPDESATPEAAIYTVIIPIFLFIVLLRFIPKLRILNYHGAEHKIVAAYINRLPITFEAVKPLSRVTKACGTMLIVPIIFYTLLLSLFVILDENILIQIFLTTISLFLIIHYFLLRGNEVSYVYFNKRLPFMKKSPYKLKTNNLYKIFDKAGYFLQEYFTTKEPSDEELEVAILCMQRLIEVKKGSC